MINLSNIASFSFQSVIVSRSSNPDFSPYAFSAATSKLLAPGVGDCLGLLGLFAPFCPGLAGLDISSAASAASRSA
jgi:hypothetical protein